MKKNINKKLQLNKETIAELDGMDNIYGGMLPSFLLFCPVPISDKCLGSLGGGCKPDVPAPQTCPDLSSC
jgi:hypothetical protein